MGYGEVGGDDSVQVSVQLTDPRLDEVEEGPAPRVHGAADGKNQRSGRAQTAAPAPGCPGRGYRGQDQQSRIGKEEAGNVFTVTIQFSRQQDLNDAKAAFAAATTVPAQVQFPVKILHRTPGQVHISWPD